MLDISWTRMSTVILKQAEMKIDCIGMKKALNNSDEYYSDCEECDIL